MKTEDELKAMKDEELRRMIREAQIEALVFKSHDDIAPVIRVLKERGYSVKFKGVPYFGEIEAAADQPTGPDWTTGEDGVPNASAAFAKIADEVEAMIHESAHFLIDGRADEVARMIVARMIVAQLAHKHGLRPG